MKTLVKRGARRTMAIALSVLMLLSAWVFVAPDTLPQASAAAGTYTAHAWLVCTDDMDNCSMTAKLYGRTNNGTGSEVAIGDGFSWDEKDVKKESYDIFNGTTSAGVFPTKIVLSLDKESYHVEREVAFEVHLQIQGSDFYLDATRHSYRAKEVTVSSGNPATFYWKTEFAVTEGYDNNYNCSYSVQDSAKPTPQYSGFSGGSSAIAVPTVATTASNGTNYSNAFSYSIGTPKDQYNVNWYQDLTVGLASSYTGISFDSTAKKIGVNCNANRAPVNNQYKYTITLKQYLGGSEVNHVDIQINTWQYKVEFYNVDKNGAQASSTTSTAYVDYGSSAVTPPGHTDNAASVPAGYVGIAADADGHYHWTGWSGAYSGFTSGPQTKVVVATYTRVNHNPSGWQKDTNVHWKKCTVCGIDLTQRNQHMDENDTWLIDDTHGEHYQNCSTCGAEVPNRRAGHTFSDYITTDTNQHWQVCEICGKERLRGNHDWDYANAEFKWTGYTCSQATVACSVCGKTKKMDVTVSCVNSPATCEADGSNVYTAKFTVGSTNYTSQKTEVLPALGHNYSGTIHPLDNDKHNWLCANGCGTYGAKQNDVWTKDASVDCTPQTGYTSDADSHWKVCSECGQELAGRTPHSWDYANAVFNWDGFACPNATVTCSVQGCGKSKTVNVTVTSETTTAQTCLGTGMKQYTATFTADGTDYTEQKDETLGALGHDWSNGVTYTWGANHESYTARRECAREGCNYYETETVNVAAETNPVPTCTSEGLRSYTSYDFENPAFSAGTDEEVLPVDPNNHDFTAQTVNQFTQRSAATCEENATYFYSCSRCHAIGDVEYFEDANTKLGHEFSGELVNAGTGKHYRKCVRFDECGAYGVQVDGVWTKGATEPCYGGNATCTERPICEGCHVVYGSIDLDNHDFSVQKKSNDYLKASATCETDAEYYYKCSRCSAGSDDATHADPSVTYDGSSWADVGSALGHSFIGDYVALENNKHSKACENSWFVGNEEVFCQCHGLEVNGEMVKDADEACTPGSFQRNEEEHWVKCAYCSNLTTPKEAHTPDADYTTDNSNHWIKCSVCGYITTAAQGHSYEEVIDLQPTCTEVGLKHNECSVCHKIKNADTEIPALGHDWGEPTYEWIPGEGDAYQVKATRVCGRNAAHMETETVDATMRLQRPTCVADGAKNYTSKRFANAAFTVQTMSVTVPLDPNYHNGHLEKVNLKKATCTVDGVKQHYFCDLCNNKYLTNTDTQPVSDAELRIEARGHSWNGGSVTTPATCSAPGVMTFTCQNTTATAEYAACRESKTEPIEIDPTNHNGNLQYVELVKATCTEDGKLAHWFCSACGNKYSDENGTEIISDEALRIAARPGGHVWNEGEITKEANCMEPGELTKTCTCEESEFYAACSATTTEPVAINPNNHIAYTNPEYLSKEGYVQESCTEDGYTGRQICLGCNTVIEEGSVIPSPGHTYTEETVKPEALKSEADCASPAIYFKSCVYCGTVEGNSEDVFEYGEIDPANHRAAPVYVAEKATTCMAPGNIAYYYCEYCDKNFTDAAGLELAGDVTVKQLPHSYTGEAVDQGDGTHRLLCVNGCNGLGDPVAHVWSDGTTKSATCDEAGYTDYACTVSGCTGTRRDVIPKLGHAFGLPTYKWNDDYTACTGTLECANDIKGDGIVDHKKEETTTSIRVETTSATCKESGRIVYTATFLDSAFGVKVTTVELERGQHVMVKFDAIPATCSEDGSSEYWVCSACKGVFADAQGNVEITLASTFVPRVGHDYSGALRDNKDGTHSYACTYECGMYGRKTAHTFNKEVATAEYLNSYSDCTTPATYFYSCECGVKGTSTFEGAPIGHELVAVPAKEATCTEAGYTAHRACTRPGCTYSTGKGVIEALGHGQYLFDHEKSGKVYDGTFEWTTYTCSRGCGDGYTLFTIYAKDTKGRVVTGANVNITGNGINVSGITGKDGSYTSEAHFSDGEYKVTITYTTGNDVLNAYGDIRVSGNRGSGGIGALELKTPEPTTQTQPTNPEPTTNPSGGNGSGNNSGSTGGCRYCGGTHTGPFGWFIQFIHNILAAFTGK